MKKGIMAINGLCVFTSIFGLLKKYYNYSCNVINMQYLFVVFLPLFVSCSDSDEIKEYEYRNSFIEIYMDGNMENIVPWAHFSIYSDDKVSGLYVIDNSQKKYVEHGLYESKAEDFYDGKATFIQRIYVKNEKIPVFLTFSYLKLTTNPSDADNLSIRVKKYTDNVLEIDTVHLMKSYEIGTDKDKIEYLYKLKL